MAPLLNPYSSPRRMVFPETIRCGFLSLHRGLFDVYEIKGKTEPKLKSILLQSAEMNCGMIATVICDNGYKDITVKFEDGTIVEHKTRQQFHNRTIKKPNLKDKQTKKTVNSCVGQSLKMHCGLVATVIEDNGCMDITVKFEDGLIRKHCRRDKFREGKIAHKDDSVK